MTNSLAAEVVLEWGDSGPDGFLFALKGKQIEHLEKVCDAPIGQIAARLFSRMPGYKDVRETVLQGLIGGGMPPVIANQKMTAFFDGQPLDATGDPSGPLKTAVAIMQAAWFGVPELVASSGEADAGSDPVTEPTSPDLGPLS